MLFGEKRLSSVIKGLDGLHAKQIADEIARAALEFSDQRLRDDLAIIVLRRVAS